MLKLTYSTAFTVSLLSWAFMQFKDGYKASGNLDFGANTVRYGTRALKRCRPRHRLLHPHRQALQQRPYNKSDLWVLAAPMLQTSSCSRQKSLHSVLCVVCACVFHIHSTIAAEHPMPAC